MTANTIPSAARLAIETRIEVRPQTEKLLGRLMEYQDRLSGFSTYFECTGSMGRPPQSPLSPDEWDRTWHRTLFERDKAFKELVAYIALLEESAPVLWEDS